MNLYAYVGNRVVNWVDLLGLDVSVGDTDDAEHGWPNTNTSGSFEGVVNESKKQYDEKNCCVRSLSISAHGNPQMIDLAPKKPNIFSKNSKKATAINEANAKVLFTGLKKSLRFCKPCVIYLLSCNTALGNLPKILARATGCRVEAPNGYCYPNRKKPNKSKIVPDVPDLGLTAYPGAGNKFISSSP